MGNQSVHLVSVVVPAYNEQSSIGVLLTQIRCVKAKLIDVDLEIIVVDDGSTDKTSEIVRDFGDVILINQTNNGKGHAVQTGVLHSSGDFILVQDADTEYSPKDYPKLFSSLAAKDTVVYGSRTLGILENFPNRKLLRDKHPDQELLPYIFNKFLTLLYFMLFGRWITDSLTGYKLYPREFLRRIEVRTDGFETDHELTCKLIKLGYAIKEVGIEYQPRTRAEGKKINSMDAIKAILTVARFRISS